MYPVRRAGEKVVLREFRLDDEEPLFDIVGDDRVTVWLAYDSQPREAVPRLLASALERARQEPRTDYALAVAQPGSNRLIGMVRLGLGGHQAAKLGYTIHADEWGKGYATDAARTLVTFGFEELKLHRITAAARPENTASIAVLERLGFEYEGHLRDHVFTNGAWRDSKLYSILSR